MRKAKSIREHVRDGTYRKDRHGPLPAGLRAGMTHHPGDPAGVVRHLAEYGSRPAITWALAYGCLLPDGWTDNPTLLRRLLAEFRELPAGSWLARRLAKLESEQ